MKTTEVAVAPTTKIFQGDWVWVINRGVTDAKSIWHNFKGQSRDVIVFGDGHAGVYKFPLKPPADDPWWQAPPSPTNAWW